MLVGEQLAGATETRLDLVDAEERAVAPAERLCALEISGGSDVHALALHRLDEEHGDVLAAELLLERVEIAERNLLEAGQQWPEALRELGVAVRRQRAEGQPVEAVVDGDDAAAPRRRAAQLERGLDRLGAGARELHALEPSGRAPEQGFGEEARQRSGAELHGARQVELERLHERVAHARVVAADVDHPEAAEHVEVAVAFGVPQIRALRPLPGAVEIDRPQHAHELRVDVARPAVEVVAPTVEQPAQIDPGHTRNLR